MKNRKTVRGAMIEALKTSGKTRTGLAREFGVNVSSVSSSINRPSVGSNIMIKLMNAMGYKIVAGKEVGGIFEPHFEIVADDERE